MDGDWIKLNRKLLESPIIQHPGMSQLWMYCLLRANWAPGKWLIPGTLKEVAIPRGSFITGREALHRTLYAKRDKDGHLIRRDFTPTSRTLWNWLYALREMQCVELQVVSSRCTMVSICNYSTYQDQDILPFPGSFQQASSTFPARFQHVSTKEEEKTEEEKRESVGIGAKTENQSTVPVDELALSPNARELAWQEFYFAYPSATKNDLEVKFIWDTLPLTEKLVGEIMDGLRRWRRSGKWKLARYIHAAKNFLMKEIWKEDPGDDRHEQNGHAGKTKEERDRELADQLNRAAQRRKDLGVA